MVKEVSKRVEKGQKRGQNGSFLGKTGPFLGVISQCLVCTTLYVPVLCTASSLLGGPPAADARQLRGTPCRRSRCTVNSVLFDHFRVSKGGMRHGGIEHGPLSDAVDGLSRPSPAATVCLAPSW